jgi:hypothetical protein
MRKRSGLPRSGAAIWDGSNAGIPRLLIGIRLARGTQVPAPGYWNPPGEDVMVRQIEELLLLTCLGGSSRASRTPSPCSTKKAEAVDGACARGAFPCSRGGPEAMVLGADGGLVSSSAPGRAVLKRAVSDCRKSLVRHDLLNGRDMDLISQSLDFVARSHPRLVLLEAGLRNQDRAVDIARSSLTARTRAGQKNITVLRTSACS